MDDCPFCRVVMLPVRAMCPYCGAITQEMKNGTRGASAPARRGADPSSGVSAGTVASPAAGATRILTVAPGARAALKKAASPGLAALQKQVDDQILAAFGLPSGPGLMPPLRFVGPHISEASANPRPPLETAPMSVGEFVGWRIWRVREEDRLLQSFFVERIWLPGKSMSGNPSDRDNEGVWAFKAADRANQKLAACTSLRMFGTFAAGSVWLWGNVVEHAEGYRAELATVRSIDIVTFGDDVLLSALRQRYGVGSAEDADKL